MIIESICLHNFMSYADAKLDLAPIKVACLTGINGAGKSALFDAVTWALWGQARSGGDELIRLGESQMWVELILQVDGKEYRVKRLRYKQAARAGSLVGSKGTLDLQIRTDGAAWKSLSATTMRETQKAISAILHMDYETFANSVYLRQGKADQFTTKSANERKQVLSDILGLSFFDDLQIKAREQATLLKSKHDALLATLDREENIDDVLANLLLEIDTTEKKLVEQLQESSEFESAIETVKENLSQLKYLQQKFDFSKPRLSEFAAEIESLHAQKAKLEAEHAETLLLLENASAIEQEARNFDLVKNQLEEFDNQAGSYSQLSTKALELKSTIAGAKQALLVEADHKKRQLAEIIKTKEKLSIQASADTNIEESYRSFKDLLVREEELSRAQEKYVQLRARIEELNMEISEKRIYLEVEYEQKKAQVQEIISILESRFLIEKEGEDLRNEHALLEQLEAEFELVEERGMAIKGKIEAIEHDIKELERRIREKQGKVHELSGCSTSSLCPLCASPILDRQQVVERYNNECENHNSEIAEHKQAIEDLNEKRSELRKEYLVLRQKLDSRKNLDQKIGRHNEKCEALKKAEEQKEKREEELAELELRLKKEDYAQMARVSLVALQSEIAAINFDPAILTSLQAQIRANRHIEVRYHQSKRDLAQLSKLEEELPALNAEVSALSERLESQDFAGAAKEELTAVEGELTKINYDPKVHQRLRQDLSEKMVAQEQMAKLAGTRAENARISEAIQSLEETLAIKLQQSSDLEKTLNNWEISVSGLPALSAQLTELQANLFACQKAQKDLSLQKAVLSERQNKLELDLAVHKKRYAEIKQLQSEINDYLFLASAFGKKGIQAVIIENAVPEIEAEANRILSMLSDNRMHVALKTQDQTRAGNTVETLDLVIADEIGTRCYELYSGGEAFKVDFAVRIALSRLLARRAGAKLETLIIDEGFGSQDEGSRQKMTKAIASIQKDFSKILVITHISELKERFPTQIHVTKEQGRSSVALVSA